jgi:lysyl-tRNA synthetase class 2
MSHVSKNSILQDRARMFAQVRAFFSERSVLEVDVPMMYHGSPIDTHIDVMEIDLQGNEKGYLHTSPEFGMKRLLSLQSGDIYQMAHVFRDGECGRLHNPEFMMVEWYRLGFTFEQMMAESVEFIALFLGNHPLQFISYRDAFKVYAGIDYLYATPRELIDSIQHHKIPMPSDVACWDKDTLLHFLMGFVIEPHLGQSGLTILKDYPASQCALAQTYKREEEMVAERFEIYYQGIELANGFHELTDITEQRQRFENENHKRAELKKKVLPLDENFLQALAVGLPDACGVAIGFDRLMLLRHKKTNLSEIMPFAWPQA